MSGVPPRPAQLNEANFWLPSSGSMLRTLGRGEPFLFKTHWPDNRIVGGGFLSGVATFHVSEAWDLFGEGNGVASRTDLLTAINRYSRSVESDPQIGCILLRDLFFAPPSLNIPGPPDFAKNIVRWKGYDLDSPEGAYVDDAFRMMLSAAPGRMTAFEEEFARFVAESTRGMPRLIIPRVGQQAFKGLVLTSYHRRCAITGGRIQPVLEAAHIRPVAREGQHRIDNGLLLRSDVHTLFDRGYLGIDTQHRLHVSKRLRADFGNGAEFYVRHGDVIDLPDRRADRPATEALAWHMDEIFERS